MQIKILTMTFSILAAFTIQVLSSETGLAFSYFLMG